MSDPNPFYFLLNTMFDPFGTFLCVALVSVSEEVRSRCHLKHRVSPHLSESASSDSISTDLMPPHNPQPQAVRNNTQWKCHCIHTIHISSIRILLLTSNLAYHTCLWIKSVDKILHGFGVFFISGPEFKIWRKEMDWPAYQATCSTIPDFILNICCNWP